MRALLQLDQLDPTILNKLSNTKLLAIKKLNELVGLIDRIITTNRTATLLKAL